MSIGGNNSRRSEMAGLSQSTHDLISGRLVTVLLFICLVFALPVAAQFDTGTINGSVSDPTGAIIPHSAVTITNSGTGIQTTTYTDGDGSFSTSGLPFGHYVVSATAANFGKATSQDLVLNVGATVRVNLTLTVAAANVSVEVTGTITTVDTTSSTAGTTLRSEEHTSELQSLRHLVC